MQDDDNTSFAGPRLLVSERWRDFYLSGDASPSLDELLDLGCAGVYAPLSERSSAVFWLAVVGPAPEPGRRVVGAERVSPWVAPLLRDESSGGTRRCRCVAGLVDLPRPDGELKNRRAGEPMGAVTRRWELELALSWRLVVGRPLLCRADYGDDGGDDGPLAVLSKLTPRSAVEQGESALDMYDLNEVLAVVLSGPEHAAVSAHRLFRELCPVGPSPDELRPRATEVCRSVDGCELAVSLSLQAGPKLMAFNVSATLGPPSTRVRVLGGLQRSGEVYTRTRCFHLDCSSRLRRLVGVLGLGGGDRKDEDPVLLDLANAAHAVFAELRALVARAPDDDTEWLVAVHRPAHAGPTAPGGSDKAWWLRVLRAPGTAEGDAEALCVWCDPHEAWSSSVSTPDLVARDRRGAAAVGSKKARKARPSENSRVLALVRSVERAVYAPQVRFFTLSRFAWWLTEEFSRLRLELRPLRHRASVDSQVVGDARALVLSAPSALLHCCGSHSAQYHRVASEAAVAAVARLWPPGAAGASSSVVDEEGCVHPPLGTVGGATLLLRNCGCPTFADSALSSALTLSDSVVRRDAAAHRVLPRADAALRRGFRSSDPLASPGCFVLPLGLLDSLFARDPLLGPAKGVGVQGFVLVVLNSVVPCWASAMLWRAGADSRYAVAVLRGAAPPGGERERESPGCLFDQFTGAHSGQHGHSQLLLPIVPSADGQGHEVVLDRAVSAILALHRGGGTAWRTTSVDVSAIPGRQLRASRDVSGEPLGVDLLDCCRPLGRHVESESGPETGGRDEGGAESLEAGEPGDAGPDGEMTVPFDDLGRALCALLERTAKDRAHAGASSRDDADGCCFLFASAADGGGGAAAGQLLAFVLGSTGRSVLCLRDGRPGLLLGSTDAAPLSPGTIQRWLRQADDRCSLFGLGTVERRGDHRVTLVGMSARQRRKTESAVLRCPLGSSLCAGRLGRGPPPLLERVLGKGCDTGQCLVGEHVRASRHSYFGHLTGETDETAIEKDGRDETVGLLGDVAAACDTLGCLEHKGGDATLRKLKTVAALQRRRRTTHPKRSAVANERDNEHPPRSRQDDRGFPVLWRAATAGAGALLPAASLGSALWAEMLRSLSSLTDRLHDLCLCVSGQSTRRQGAEEKGDSGTARGATRSWSCEFHMHCVGNQQWIVWQDAHGGGGDDGFGSLCLGMSGTPSTVSPRVTGLSALFRSRVELARFLLERFPEVGAGETYTGVVLSVLRCRQSCTAEHSRSKSAHLVLDGQVLGSAVYWAPRVGSAASALPSCPPAVTRWLEASGCFGSSSSSLGRHRELCADVLVAGVPARDVYRSLVRCRNGLLTCEPGVPCSHSRPGGRARLTPCQRPSCDLVLVARSPGDQGTPGTGPVRSGAIATLPRWPDHSHSHGPVHLTVLAQSAAEDGEQKPKQQQEGSRESWWVHGELTMDTLVDFLWSPRRQSDGTRQRQELLFDIVKVRMALHPAVAELRRAAAADPPLFIYHPALVIVSDQQALSSSLSCVPANGLVYLVRAIATGAASAGPWEDGASFRRWLGSTRWVFRFLGRLAGGDGCASPLDDVPVCPEPLERLARGLSSERGLCCAALLSWFCHEMDLQGGPLSWLVGSLAEHGERLRPGMSVGRRYTALASCGSLETSPVHDMATLLDVVADPASIWASHDLAAERPSAESALRSVCNAALSGGGDRAGFLVSQLPCMLELARARGLLPDHHHHPEEASTARADSPAPTRPPRSPTPSSSSLVRGAQPQGATTDPLEQMKEQRAAEFLERQQAAGRRRAEEEERQRQRAPVVAGDKAKRAGGGEQPPRHRHHRGREDGAAETAPGRATGAVTAPASMQQLGGEAARRRGQLNKLVAQGKCAHCERDGPKESETMSVVWCHCSMGCRRRLHKRCAKVLRRRIADEGEGSVRCAQLPPRSSDGACLGTVRLSLSSETPGAGPAPVSAQTVRVSEAKKKQQQQQQKKKKETAPPGEGKVWVERRPDVASGFPREDGAVPLVSAASTKSRLRAAVQTPVADDTARARAIPAAGPPRSKRFQRRIRFSAAPSTRGTQEAEVVPAAPDVSLVSAAEVDWPPLPPVTARTGTQAAAGVAGTTSDHTGEDAVAQLPGAPSLAIGVPPESGLCGSSPSSSSTGPAVAFLPPPGPPLCGPMAFSGLGQLFDGRGRETLPVSRLAVAAPDVAVCGWRLLSDVQSLPASLDLGSSEWSGTAGGGPVASLADLSRSLLALLGRAAAFHSPTRLGDIAELGVLAHDSVVHGGVPEEVAVALAVWSIRDSGGGPFASWSETFKKARAAWLQSAGA